MTPPTGQYQDREREFHDRVYGSGEYRERPANRFYELAGAAFDRYDALLRSRIEPGTEVLECGCGEGDDALRIARLGARVTGIDISEVAVEHAAGAAAAQGLESTTTFRAMDCEALDLADDSFDVACGEGVLHHVDLDRTLAEIARVLRPSGSAVFLEPMGHNPLINAYRRVTPGQRTEDEHPLLSRDLEVAERRFATVETEFFSLLSLAALPLRTGRTQRRVVAALDRADRALFRGLPFSRRHAWIVILRLSAPR